MQEGDVQIKGYPVRLELDVVLAFSANPEDYTARGKIVTPLKDRIGSEIRTHYPETIEEGMAITAQEAWSERGRCQDRHSAVPARGDRAGGFLRARRQEGGQAQRREPASAHLDDGAGGFECRAARVAASEKKLVVPRVSDIYAAMPGITGKLELEYEGEMRGADTVVRELIRDAVGKDLRQVLRAAPTRSRSSSGSTWAARWARRRSAGAGHPGGTEADSGLVCAAVAAVGEGFGRAPRSRWRRQSFCSKGMCAHAS